MVVKRVRGDWLMLLSYWDAGHIVLNVNDPANPVFVNDTQFTDPDPETAPRRRKGNNFWGVQTYRAPGDKTTYVLASDRDSGLWIFRFTGGDEPDQGGRPLSATLTGAEEVPGPGDPDGSGQAELRLNPGQGEVCWTIDVEGIDLPATAAHIHAGAAGVAGPVVVTLSPPDEGGTASGCQSNIARDLIRAIIQHPEEYYVNVHNAAYPDGAVRGQLSP